MKPLLFALSLDGMVIIAMIHKYHCCWHWYEIMSLNYVKSILTEISASRQDKMVLQKSKVIRIKFFEHMGHATDVWIRLEI